MSSVPSWARKGARCVCIKRGAWGFFPDVPLWLQLAIRFTGGLPVAGCEYIVAEAGFDRETDQSYISLRGLSLWWPISAFRPLVEPKTEAEDLALFSDHLRATPPLSTTRRAPVEGADV